MNKHPPHIYVDIHGREWITAEGLLLYYQIRVVDSTKQFYLLDDMLRRCYRDMPEMRQGV